HRRVPEPLVRARSPCAASLEEEAAARELHHGWSREELLREAVRQAPPQGEGHGLHPDAAPPSRRLSVAAARAAAADRLDSFPAAPADFVRGAAFLSQFQAIRACKRVALATGPLAVRIHPQCPEPNPCWRFPRVGTRTVTMTVTPCCRKSWTWGL